MPSPNPSTFLSTLSSSIQSSISKNNQLFALLSQWSCSKKVFEALLRTFYLAHCRSVVGMAIPKEADFARFVKCYDGESHKAFVEELKEGRYNEVGEERWMKVVSAVGATKYKESEVVNFEGYLKIKHYLMDRQATEEELEQVKEVDYDFYEQFLERRNH
jgi:hypothetical protein